MGRSTRLTVDLGEQLFGKVEQLSQLKGKSKSDIVRELVQLGVERFGMKTRIEGVVAGGVCTQCHQPPENGVLLAVSFAGQGHTQNVCQPCHNHMLEQGLWLRDD